MPNRASLKHPGSILALGRDEALLTVILPLPLAAALRAAADADGDTVADIVIDQIEIGLEERAAAEGLQEPQSPIMAVPS